MIARLTKEERDELKNWLSENFKTGSEFYEIDINAGIEKHIALKVENGEVTYEQKCFEGECKCEKTIMLEELSWDSEYFIDKRTAIYRQYENEIKTEK